jgi:hypothetical protein
MKTEGRSKDDRRRWQENTAMENREKIQRASRRLRYLLSVAICLMPVINAIFWLNMNRMPDLVLRKIIPLAVTMPMPLISLVLGFLVTMLPTGVTMVGAYYLRRLFVLYEQGQIFLLANVLCFKKLSRVLIWSFAVGIVSSSLLSVVLSLPNPPGQRIVTVELNSSDLTVLLLGGILAVISWVMEEGRNLQEEQDLTV